MSLVVDKQSLLAKLGEINSLDEALDAASGSTQAGKRKLANELKTEFASEAASMVASIQKFFEDKLDDDIRRKIGFFRNILDGMDEFVGKEADAYLQALVDAQTPADKSTISDDEIAALSEKRKNLVKMFQAMKAIAEVSGEEIDGVGDPRVRRGSVGKKGPRVFGKFNFSIDGVPQSKSQNSLSHVAKALKFSTTAAFREFLAENGLNMENPPDSWEFRTADGKVVTASPKSPEEVEVVPEEDDDDDDNE